MNHTERLALRASATIHEALVDAHRRSPHLDLPDAAWQRCQQLIRRIDKAVRRRWHRAAERLEEQLKFALAEFRRQSEQLLRAVDTRRSTDLLATRHDLFRDLVALDEEFDDVELCSRECRVSAATDAIVLEGIDLGRFRIELRWDELGQRQPYSVIALDPNPAASSSETTHPHVQDDDLCEGDGRVPIRQALEQGRLLDFFIMVRQILQTYNSGSAYVSLEDWHGVECHDCGRTVSGDDRDTCERCDADLCSECSTGCRSCDRRFCGECVASCSGCDDFFCSRCLGRCGGCQQQFCEECLTDEKCTTCREAETAEDEEDEIQPAPAGSAVHPLRLGEAAVSAGSG